MLYGCRLNRSTRVKSVLATSNRLLTLSRPPSPTKVEAPRSKQKTMSKVFVLDTTKHPLNPVHPGRARILLDAGKAAIFKRFPTGDMVKAIVPSHLKHAGTYEGRLSAKARGGFTIATRGETITDIGKTYCRKVQRADGYGYSCLSAAFFPPIPFKGWAPRKGFYGPIPTMAPTSRD